MRERSGALGIFVPFVLIGSDRPDQSTMKMTIPDEDDDTLYDIHCISLQVRHDIRTITGRGEIKEDSNMVIP